MKEEHAEREAYLEGMNDMLDWILSLPINGGAGRIFNVQVYPIIDWMEKANKINKTR